ncbi:MAG: hypothetical protein LBS77_01815 [Desulfovibrio sp.]|jgi:hypothetical protein|nr:hypothetical protein [Desulfovibrio sp.]
MKYREYFSREYFSIVIMSDKTRHSFRMRGGLFYALLCVVACLPLLVVGLGWFSYRVWQENNHLRDSTLRFKDDFQKARSTAERLENMEKLFSESTAQGKDVLARRLAAPDESGPLTRPDTPAKADNGPAQTPQPQPPSMQGEFLAVNTGYVRVDNVQVRVLHENRLRIALDLRNADDQKLAVGRISAVLLTADGDGARHELAFASDHAGNFRIRQFLRTVMLAILSPQMSLVNAQVVLEVRKEDSAVVYRDIFAVEQ